MGVTTATGALQAGGGQASSALRASVYVDGTMVRGRGSRTACQGRVPGGRFQTASAGKWTVDPGGCPHPDELPMG